MILQYWLQIGSEKFVVGVQQVEDMREEVLRLKPLDSLGYSQPNVRSTYLV